MKDVQKVTLAALFVAIGAFFKIYSIQVTESMRISLFAIPIMLAGFYLGPFYGLLAGFAVDTVYFMISPYASIWSLYTITTTAWGLVGFLIKKFHNRFGIFSLIFFIFFASIFETSFNTFANYIYGLDIWVTLLSRIITMFIRVPLLVFIMNLLVNKLKVFHLEAIKT